LHDRSFTLSKTHLRPPGEGRVSAYINGSKILSITKVDINCVLARFLSKEKLTLRVNQADLKVLKFVFGHPHAIDTRLRRHRDVSGRNCRISQHFTKLQDFAEV
jgi:hypothetical protein